MQCCSHGVLGLPSSDTKLLGSSGALGFHHAQAETDGSSTCDGWQKEVFAWLTFRRLYPPPPPPRHLGTARRMGARPWPRGHGYHERSLVGFLSSSPAPLSKGAWWPYPRATVPSHPSFLPKGKMPGNTAHYSCATFGSPEPPGPVLHVPLQWW